MKLNFESSDLIREKLNYKLLESLFNRPGLGNRDRILVSIAALQTRPGTILLKELLSILQFEDHEIPTLYEVLLQGYLFCGFPRAIESLICFHDLLKARNVSLTNVVAISPPAESDDLFQMGLDLSRNIHQGKFDLIHKRIIEISPDLGYLMIHDGYGRILNRPQLDIRSRELAIIGSLTALRSPRQLESHIRGARNVGCSDLEIYEAIFTSLICLKPAYIRDSLQIWKKITGKEITDSLSGFVV